MDNPQARIAHLTALRDLNTDTSVSSKQGDSLATIALLSTADLKQIFDVQMVAFDDCERLLMKPEADVDYRSQVSVTSVRAPQFIHRTVSRSPHFQTLYDVGISSQASAKHPEENHDRATVFMMDGVRVTVLCDGLSSCGHGVTGEAAAVALSTGIEAQCMENDTFLYTLNSLIALEDQNPGCLSGESLDATINMRIAASFRNMKVELAEILNTLGSTIDPPTSATTFEMSFELSVGDKLFLIAFSIGDSQTLVYDSALQEIHQLNAGVYHKPRLISSDYTAGETSYFQKNLNTAPRVFKPISNPGGFVSGATEMTYDKISLTLCPLNPGDMVITASDGLTDNFSVLRDGHRTRVEKGVLADFITDLHAGGFSDEVLAQHLVQAAFNKKLKLDDITVCVHTV